MHETITIKYSCVSCGIDNIAVEVACRQTEDVVVWVERVMALAISDDHFKRSPHCTSRSMSKVMIPVTGVDKIGGPIIQ
jgi:hypothetical protein